jgi:hypothetical protein
LGFDVRALINQLLTGCLKTPHGDLLFAASGGHHAASFQPFHPDGLLNQQRFNVLSLMGGETENIRQPEIDWEIKAASRPHDGLQELANEFSLGQLVQRPLHVEAVAFNVAAIDLRKSKVAGTNADIHVLMAKGLSRDRVTLDYRAYVPMSTTTRAVVSGATMQWTEEDQADCGHITLQIPTAAALNCTVSYDGIAQHHFWLGDPERTQNPRRAVYEAFDPQLETLMTTIGNAQGRGENARDLESAVAWLLWMLGFSIAHLNTRRTRDAADLLVTTPLGHFAIVECTTGLLKAENKLSLLHERAEAARRGLTASNSAHLRLTPIMVTSKMRADITPDLEAADKLGILVMTRESLEGAINRTLIHPTPDQMYDDAERTIREAVAKYKSLTRNEACDFQAFASRRVRMRMWATRSQATALAIVVSKSLASLRHRPSQAKVRSTTQRRGRTSKPAVWSERLMMSMVHCPTLARALRSLSPA